MQARTKALAEDLIAACHRSSNLGDDLAREVLKVLADQLGPDPTRPELCNPKGGPALHAFNTPTGVILQINSASGGQREYSQFFSGWWVLPDGSWTRTPPASIPRDPGLIDQLDYLVDLAESAPRCLSGSEIQESQQSNIEAAHVAILEAIS